MWIPTGYTADRAWLDFFLPKSLLAGLQDEKLLAFYTCQKKKSKKKYIYIYMYDIHVIWKIIDDSFFAKKKAIHRFLRRHRRF